MKQYTASDELVNIFFKHGFVEKTSKHFPKHANLLKESDVYDPDSVKRVLVHKRDYNYIYFDYINIKIVHRGNHHNLHFLSLNENELKSILAFFSLSSEDRWDLNKHVNFKITELYKYYLDCKEEQKHTKLKVVQRRVIDAYENIIL